MSTSTRSVTPGKRIPMIDVSNIDPNTFVLYLNCGELPVSRGYPAPSPKHKEIRKCQSCMNTYLIVEKTSSKTDCGFCTEHAQ